MDSAMWRDKYPILDASHGHELEARAAVRELADGVPPRDAEAQAHGEYLREHMGRAAAHHLAGVRAAHAAGDLEEAARHSLRYGVMARALKFDPHGEPPPDIAALARDPAHSKVYGFKPHEADAVLLTHLLGQHMAKAEGDDPTPPLGGVPLPDRSGPGHQAWDLSHVLPDLRRTAGEQLVVVESPQGRTVHVSRDEAGRRVPLYSLAEADGGPEPIGSTVPEDVRKAADLALRLRRAAAMAQIVDRVRRTTGAIDAARTI